MDQLSQIFSSIRKSYQMNKRKIHHTIGLSWVLFIGYLVWWNGVNSRSLYKGFNWSEWLWFGIIPVISIYLFSSIWSKGSTMNSDNISDKSSGITTTSNSNTIAEVAEVAEVKNAHEEIKTNDASLTNEKQRIDIAEEIRKNLEKMKKN